MLSARVHLDADPGFPPGGARDIQYAVTACGPSPIDVALYLTGDARLQHLHPYTAGAVAQSLEHAPFGEPGSAQLLSMRIDPPPCPPESRTHAFLGSGFALGGTWTRGFITIANGHGTFAFPRVGRATDDLQPARREPGLKGKWSSPPDLTVSISGGQLAAQDRIDLAKPATNNTFALEWRGRDFLRPVAFWTNISATGNTNRQLIIFSVILGVGIALLAAAVQRWIESYPFAA